MVVKMLPHGRAWHQWSLNFVLIADSSSISLTVAQCDIFQSDRCAEWPSDCSLVLSHCPPISDGSSTCLCEATTAGRWASISSRWLRLLNVLAHQNRTIAIASDFRVDGAKSPEIPQKEWVLGSEVAARNRKSLATFHRTLKSQCSIALSCLGNR